MFPEDSESGHPFFLGKASLLKAEDLYAEEGPDADSTEVERVTPDERKAAAEIAVFLEDNIGVDLKRIYIRVKAGVVFLQGSVQSIEQRKEIEELLPKQSGVREIELNLVVHDN